MSVVKMGENMLHMCVVPQCENNTKDNLDKLFVKVPMHKKLRKKWLQLAGAEPALVSNNNSFFCEDHFDVTKDIANYKLIKLSAVRIIEQSFRFFPSKFQCQRKSLKEVIPPKIIEISSISSVTRKNILPETQNDGKEHTAEDKKCMLAGLDKFKRRLVRAVARHMFEEKTPKKQMWAQLEKETGRNCELLWTPMRVLTLTKVNWMLSVEDRLDGGVKLARLTLTEWLLYDLVLVHEKIDVIGQDLPEERKILEELFNLVKKYKIESLEGDLLVSAWMNLTLEYNGVSRQCSPMLLQRRWYQMKEAARLKFYSFWSVFRGIAQNLRKALQDTPTEMQRAIAERYGDIVTKKFLTWEELIQAKKIVLPEEFERMDNLRAGKNRDENAPDIEVVEKYVETINLDEDSESENNGINLEDLNLEREFQSSYDDMAELILNPSTSDCLVKDEPDEREDETDEDEPFMNNQSMITSPETEITEEDFEEAEVKFEPNTILPGEILDANLPTDTNENEDHNTEISESEQQNDSTMPKILSVIGATGIIQANETNDKISEESDTQIGLLRNTLALINNDNPVTEVEHASKDIPTQEAPIEHTPIDTVVAMTIGLPVQEIIDESSEKRSLDEEIDDFADNIDFSGGIEFEDDGIEFIDEDNNPNDSNITTKFFNEGKKPSEFYPKLLLLPKVCINKLTNTNAAAESTAIDIKIIQSHDMEIIDNRQEMPEPVAVDEYMEDDDSKGFCEEKYYTLKCSNWMLQKPKKRTYNPIQLCKNPDFNTRLKRLPAGFFISERNRTMLKDCKPMTIDVHKSFANKLVNGTLIVKGSRFVSKINVSFTDVKQESVLINTSVVTKNTKIQPTHDMLFKDQEPTVKIPNKLLLTELKNKVVSLDVDKKYDDYQKLDTAVIIPQRSVTIPADICRIKNSYKVIADGCDMNESETNILANNVDRACSIYPVITKNKRKKALSRLQMRRKLVKTLGMPQRKPDKYPRIPWVKNDKKHHIDDNLLTSDSLSKMLKILSGESDSAETKKEKIYMAKLRNKERKMNENFQPKVLIPNPDTAQDDIRKAVNVNENVNNDDENQDDIGNQKGKKQLSPKEKRKRRTRAELLRVRNEIFVAQSGTSYCCWARARNSNDANINDHKCVKRSCYCCCRQMILKRHRSYKQNQNNKLLHEKSQEINTVIDNSGNSFTVFLQSSESSDDAKISCPTPLSRITLKSKNIKTFENSVKRDCTKPAELLHAKKLDVLTKTNINSIDDLDNNIEISIGLNCPANLNAENEINNTNKNSIVTDSKNAIDTNPGNIKNHDNTTYIYKVNDEPQRCLIGNNMNNEVSHKIESSSRPNCNIHTNTLNKQCNASNILRGSNAEISFKVKTNLQVLEDPNVLNVQKQCSFINLNTSNNLLEDISYRDDKSASENKTFLNAKELLKKKPVFLGVNKILLSSVKPPCEEICEPQSLPQGVHIISLPNKELALSINSDVNLDCNQLSNLSTILESAQQQINNNLGLLNSVEISNLSVNQDHGDVTHTSKFESIFRINDLTVFKQIQESVDTIDAHVIADISKSDFFKNDDRLTVSLRENISAGEICNRSNQKDYMNIDSPIKKVEKTTVSISNSNNQQNTGVVDIDVTKKTILSDLMEMSGISAEDTKNGQIDNSQTNLLHVNLSQNSPQLKTTSEKLDTNNVYTSIVINSLEKRPDLNVVTSYNELKYSSERNAKFYKMDLITGNITPIQVLMKKRNQQFDRKGPLNTEVKSVIDLTDDQEDDVTPNFNLSPETSEAVTNISNYTMKVKPLKRFRAANSTIIKRNSESNPKGPTIRPYIAKMLLKKSSRKRKILFPTDISYDSDGTKFRILNDVISSANIIDDQTVKEMTTEVLDETLLSTDTVNNRLDEEMITEILDYSMSPSPSIINDQTDEEMPNEILDDTILSLADSVNDQTNEEMTTEILDDTILSLDDSGDDQTNEEMTTEILDDSLFETNDGEVSEDDCILGV